MFVLISLFKKWSFEWFVSCKISSSDKYHLSIFCIILFPFEAEDSHLVPKSLWLNMTTCFSYFCISNFSPGSDQMFVSEKWVLYFCKYLNTETINWNKLVTVYFGIFLKHVKLRLFKILLKFLCMPCLELLSQGSILKKIRNLLQEHYLKTEREKDQTMDGIQTHDLLIKRFAHLRAPISAIVDSWHPLSQWAMNTTTRGAI